MTSSPPLRMDDNPLEKAITVGLRIYILIIRQRQVDLPPCSRGQRTNGNRAMPPNNGLCRIHRLVIESVRPSVLETSAIQPHREMLLKFRYR